MEMGKPLRRRFQPAAIRPAADVVARQMEATTLAYRRLGSVEAVRHFLNDHDERLGGRPLDIAGDSLAGLNRIGDVLAEPRYDVGPSADSGSQAIGLAGTAASPNHINQ